MKVTKYVHSCLLVEDGGHTVLCNPGVFSWDAGIFSVDKLDRLGTVIITHEHPDHFHPPFVQALIEKFPDVLFVSTPSVVTQLKELGVTNATSESQPDFQIFSRKPHASLPPLGETPENIALHLFDKLTEPGDRHDAEETKDVLALPMTAPWGSAVGAANMALRLKPKTVIPIHDWHWNDKARQIEYDRFEKVLGEHSIRFIKAVNGETFEV